MGDLEQAFRDVGTEILDYIVATRFESLPAAAVHAAKRVLLDCLACILAGTATGEAAGLDAYLAGRREEPESTVIGRERKTGCGTAALVNASYSQVHDYNDGHPSAGALGGAYHPGRVVIPAALAVGEKVQASGKDLLAAIVVGYDVAARIRSHAWQSPVPDAYSAAAVAGRLLGLDARNVHHALGLAGCACPCNNGSTVDFDSDFLNNGMLVKAGVDSALFASCGFSGPPLNDDRRISTRFSTRGLGAEYEIERTYFKPYPTCRMTHGAIDAVLELRAGHGLRPEDIAEIVVYQLTHGMYVSYPVDEKCYYKRLELNLQYPVACAVVDGKVGLEQFSPKRTTDPALHAVARKVRVVADESMDAVYPDTCRPTGVEMKTVKGEVFSRVIRSPRGGGDHPMADRDLEGKFMDCARLTMDESRASEAAKAVWRLDGAPDLQPLMDLLSRAPR